MDKWFILKNQNWKLPTYVTHSPWSCHILNIFWKQKIVMTVWPVRVYSNPMNYSGTLPIGTIPDTTPNWPSSSTDTGCHCTGGLPVTTGRHQLWWRPGMINVRYRAYNLLRLTSHCHWTKESIDHSSKMLTSTWGWCCAYMYNLEKKCLLPLND